MRPALRIALMAGTAYAGSFLFAGRAQAYCISPIHVPCCTSPCPIIDASNLAYNEAIANMTAAAADAGRQIGSYTGLTALYEYATNVIGGEGPLASPLDAMATPEGRQALMSQISGISNAASRLYSATTNLSMSSLASLAGNVAMTQVGSGNEAISMGLPYARALAFGGDPLSVGMSAAQDPRLQGVALDAFNNAGGSGITTAISGFRDSVREIVSDDTGRTRDASGNVGTATSQNLGGVATNLMNSSVGRDINAADPGVETADMRAVHNAARAVGADGYMGMANQYNAAVASGATQNAGTTAARAAGTQQAARSQTAACRATSTPVVRAAATAPTPVRTTNTPAAAAQRQMSGNTPSTANQTQNAYFAGLRTQAMETLSGDALGKRLAEISAEAYTARTGLGAGTTYRANAGLNGVFSGIPAPTGAVPNLSNAAGSSNDSPEPTPATASGSTPSETPAAAGGSGASSTPSETPAAAGNGEPSSTPTTSTGSGTTPAASQATTTQARQAATFSRNCAPPTSSAADAAYAAAGVRPPDDAVYSWPPTILAAEVGGGDPVPFATISNANEVLSRRLYPDSLPTSDDVRKLRRVREANHRATATDVYGYATTARNNIPAVMAEINALRVANSQDGDVRGTIKLNTNAKQALLRQFAVVTNLIAARTQMHAAAAVLADENGTWNNNRRHGDFSPPAALLPNMAQVSALLDARATISQAEAAADVAQAMHDDLSALNYAERDRASLRSMIEWSENTQSGATSRYQQSTSAAALTTSFLGGSQALTGTYNWTPPTADTIERLLLSADTTGWFDVSPTAATYSGGPTNLRDATAASAAAGLADRVLATVPPEVWYQPCSDGSGTCSGERDYAQTRLALAQSYASMLVTRKYAVHMASVATEARQTEASLDASRAAFTQRWGVDPSAARAKIEEAARAVPSLPGSVPGELTSRSTDLDRRVSQILGDTGNLALVPPSGTNSAFEQLPDPVNRADYAATSAWSTEMGRLDAEYQLASALAAAAGKEQPPPPVMPPPPQAGIFTPTNQPAPPPAGQLLQ